MSAEYVRRYYGVPAKRGMRVTVEGWPGVIVSFPGQYIGVRFDGETITSRCHPTWEVDYEPDKQEKADQAEQAAHYEATAATMTPEQVRTTMERVRARRKKL